ncbi:hypothetical protein MMC22_004554 [Lobaria immixta]|nr:hypothetical protein [Lobaria immixta]
MAAQADTSRKSFTEVKVACHCSQLSATVEVPTHDLPLKIWMCSCDTCRYSTGMLAITCAFLPKGYQNFKVTGKAARYATSQGPAALIRCFCGTCGTFVYEDSPDKARVSLCAGAMTKVKGVAEIAGLAFAGDTRDGGISEWLPNIKAYDQDVAPRGDYTPNSPARKHPYGENLHCKCHCGGVDFWITRPHNESHHLSSGGVNDCFEPDFKPTPERPAESVNWWIRGGEKKYAALLCMCNACRQTTGFDVQPWAYVPLVNMVLKDGSPLKLSRITTLKQYSSSKGVDRYFCGTCGANVFFVKHVRPKLLDFSVGLADAESGARAEEWFEWTHILSDAEFAQKKQLAKELEEGLEQWSKRTGKSAVKVQ